MTWLTQAAVALTESLSVYASGLAHRPVHVPFSVKVQLIKLGGGPGVVLLLHVICQCCCWRDLPTAQHVMGCLRQLAGRASSRIFKRAPPSTTTSGEDKKPT